MFHVIKLQAEHERHSWVTGFYWTLVVMSTLGFGDITFTSDTGRIFSIVVLLSGVVFLLVMLPFLFIRLFYAPWLEARVRLRAPREVPAAVEQHVIIAELDPIALLPQRQVQRPRRGDVGRLGPRHRAARYRLDRRGAQRAVRRDREEERRRIGALEDDRASVRNADTERVGRVQHAIVFHGERGEMGVGNQVAQRIPAAEHLLKKGPMLIGRLDDAHARLVEPALHTLGGFLERERTLM